MKLLYSETSPFVRKVTICARELGILDAIEMVRSSGNVLVRDAGVRAINPLGQLPALITDDGTYLYGSGVICAYLNDRAGGELLGSGDQRWAVLTNAALGDGLIEAAVGIRYELALRPAEARWPAWADALQSKIDDALNRMEALAPGLPERRDLGAITFACGLSYLDWRFSGLDWRSSHPQLDRWYSQARQQWDI